ncbi:MAG: hypothetical protein HYV97_18110 [Bdellovibrio sp.]|nr:hypothetical protein [Bdellovibrio sp.]
MLNKKSVLVLLVLFSSRSFSAEMKVSTLFFGDYYWNKHTDTAANNGLHGLALRRIYVTLDSSLDEKHDAKLQLEANQASPTAPAANSSPYIKQANVTRKFGSHAASIGMVGTPTWSTVETYWIYRDVEKTPVDLLGWGGAVDGGVSLKGSFMDKMLMYHVLYGNGAKTGQETDKYKQFYASLGFSPVSGLLIELYSDKKDSFKSQTGATVNQLYIAYQMEGLSTGVQYAAYKLETQSGGVASVDIKRRVISAHAAKTLTETWSALARYDMVEAYTDASVNTANLYYLSTSANATEYNLLILGADYKSCENFHIIPNIERVTYSEQKSTVTTVRPKADEIVRITFSYKF